jgi:acyl-CoA reductase-like NAD-dependent aldehyde dehydrogenase
MDSIDQATLEHIRARFASPATPQDVRDAVQAFKEGFKEWDS